MSGVAVANHISCAVAFLTVSAILMSHRPTRTQFPILILSCAFTAVWSISVALFYYGLFTSNAPMILFDVISDAFWLLSLIQLLQLNQRINKKTLTFRLFCASIISATLLFLLGYVFLKNGNEKYALIAHIILCVMMLALVEQLYRGTSPQRRIGIKLLCMGVGFMYSYDLFMYANAALSHEISARIMQIRGGVLATIAPLIGLSALSHRKWRTEILPSRAVIFRSSVFISSGLYLLFMTCMGFLIRDWMGPFGTVFQLSFFVGSLGVLYLILSSGKIRSSLKHFIAKNFFKLRYDYREEWLKFSTLLSNYADHQELSQRVIKAMAGIVESPKGILFEFESKRGYVLKDCFNEIYPNREIVIEHSSFIEFLERSTRSIELPPRFIDNPSMKIPHAIREFDWAWLVVPLFHGNHLHAFVVLAHPQIAFYSLNWEVMDLLSMAGRQAAVCLVQDQNAQELLVAKQFEDNNRVSTFAMHDLKNVNSQLRLIQANKAKYQHDERFMASVYQTIDHVAARIDHLLVQMKTRNHEASTHAIDLYPIIQKVIELNTHRDPVPRLNWQLKTKSVQVMGNEDNFINILSHLVENAQQATPRNGEVVLSVQLNQDQLEVAISDTGCGMTPEFVHMNLYRPFVTTKGEQGVGIGVYEAREYLHHVGGKLTVETVKDKGSVFRIAFPQSPILSNATA